MVAEDFALNQEVIRLMLADTSYEPHFANNGKEAVEIYKSDPDKFAAILMDISMPVMDGYQASHFIRNIEDEHDYSAKPIIALTGHALKHDREKCLSAGMSDYIAKPIRQEHLLKKLEDHLNTSESLSDAEEKSNILLKG